MRARPKDGEKDSVGMAEFSDGMMHAFRETDDGRPSQAAKPVCGADLVLRGAGTDDTRSCKPCCIWLFTWAGVPDPEAEFARLGD